MHAATMLWVLATMLSVGTASASEKVACVQAAEEGQDLRDAGKLGGASLEFQRCARSSCPRAVAIECSAWLEEVQARTPSVIVHAQASGGAPLEGASLSIDGLPMGTCDGAARAVDPGDHVVRVTEGARVVEAVVSVREGQPDTPLWLVLPEKPAPVPVRSLEAAVPPRSQARATEGHATLWPAYLLSGVSVAALGSFAYFGLQARHEFDQLQASCGDHCSQSSLGSLHLDADVADTTLGLGLLAAGAAVWAWLSPPRHRTTMAFATPFVGPTGAGVFGSF